jgi:hypothetical protein
MRGGGCGGPGLSGCFMGIELIEQTISELIYTAEEIF